MGNMIQLTVDGTPLDVYEAKPSVNIKGGLIVIEEVWGLTDHIKSVADRYAAEGYWVLSPELLAETDIKKHAATLMLNLFNPEKRSETQPKLRELMAPMNEPQFAPKTVNRLHACFDYLYDKPETEKHVSITGFCFGGSYSYQLAVAEPRLKAAVPFYGHAPLDEDVLKDIVCPVLAFYGEKDENLIKDLPELQTKMTAAGVQYEAIVYPDCGHAFFNDTNPYAYNPAAAQDAWERALNFLSA